ncbi:MAG TPA: phosphopantetheine-binding protein [Legionella sp.]|nr:phosphopantetheine-binding protein [Legionella sp.]
MTMHEDISQRVMDVIARVQKITVAEVNAALDLEALGMDSFDAINLIFALEEEFNIELPDNAKEYKYIGEIIMGIETLMEQSQVTTA